MTASAASEKDVSALAVSFCMGKRILEIDEKNVYNGNIEKKSRGQNGRRLFWRFRTGGNDFE